jgi:hypothetical protein
MVERLVALRAEQRKERRGGGTDNSKKATGDLLKQIRAEAKAGKKAKYASLLDSDHYRACVRACVNTGPTLNTIYMTT